MAADSNWQTLNSHTAPTDEKFTLVEGLELNSSNYSPNSELVIDAKIISDCYKPSSDRAEYFTHPSYQDVKTGNTQGTADLLYKRIISSVNWNFSAFNEFMTVYEPYEMTENLQNPILVSFRGTASWFSLVQDLSLILKYYSNSYLDTTLSTIYQTCDIIVQQLLLLHADTLRPLRFLSHSLGCTISNYITMKLLQNTVSTQAVAGISQHLYQPLLFIDEAWMFQRDYPASDTSYNPRTQNLLECCQGDYVTGPLTSFGWGTVTTYSLSVQTLIENPFDMSNTGVARFIHELTPSTLGGTSSILRNALHADQSHSIDSFITDNIPLTKILSSYDELTSISIPGRGITIETHVVKNLQNHTSVSGGQLTSHSLYLSEPNNRHTYSSPANTRAFWEYPHEHNGIVNPDSFYQYDMILDPITPYYTITSNDISGTTDTQLYVNFPLILTCRFPGNSYNYKALLERLGDNWYHLIEIGGQQSLSIVGVTHLAEITFPSSAVYKTEAEFLALTDLPTIARFDVRVIPGIVHSGPRRSLLPTPVYTGIDALMQVPGNYGYFKIGMHGTSTNTDLLYMEAPTNNIQPLTVYARTPPTSEGSFGISHLDNNPTWSLTSPPSDEHIWKIVRVSAGVYTIENTAYSGAYIGSFGSVSGTMHGNNSHYITLLVLY